MSDGCPQPKTEEKSEKQPTTGVTKLPITDRYRIVPNGISQNLRFRRDLLIKCHNDLSFREAVMQAWRDDCLFWFNTACIAEGTLVLTPEGGVPIEDIQPHHQVWDGKRWVNHDGVLYQGRKKVIQEYGITLTGDHKVWTVRGWQEAEKRRPRQEIASPYAHNPKEKSPVLDVERAKVYDIANCGPRKAFTVIDKDGGLLLVHNCWVLEPRPRKVNGVTAPKKMPFIAWDHQVPAILEIREHLGFNDILVEKSRGEGMSWLSVLLAMHSFFFSPLSSIGLISKDEESASSPTNPDSLMYKCQFTLDNMPPWLRGQRNVDWKRDISKNTLINLKNGSGIAAYSSTGDVASGGRKTWMLMDELAKFPRPADRDAMASTQHVTDCRLIVSTPKGADGAYYDFATQESNRVKVVLDWKQNPTRNRGMYRMVDGYPVAIDPSNPLPDNYANMTPDVIEMFNRLRRRGYRIEGCDRSPWYDRECDRGGATPQNIAQELDRDYGGSVARVLSDTALDRAAESVADPVVCGDLSFDKASLRDSQFIESPSGPMKLWTPLDFTGNPPPGSYVMGVDIATGTGNTWSSNSVISMVNMVTREQVFEYASNTISVPDFADLCIAVAHWFYDAYLSWEINGPGSGFSNRVIEREYFNLYRRRVDWKSTARRTIKEIGWHTDSNSSEVMFATMGNALTVGDVVVKSAPLARELSNYIRKDGKIYHALIANAGDDSRGASHGDRAMALGVCVMAMKDRPLAETTEVKGAPIGSFARRNQEWEESRSTSEWGNLQWDL